MGQNFVSVPNLGSEFKIGTEVALKVTVNLADIIARMTSGAQGALGGTGAANTYIGADNQAHLLPATPTIWSHWRSGAGATTLPDGVNDLAEPIRRDGLVGINRDPVAQLHVSSTLSPTVSFERYAVSNTSCRFELKKSRGASVGAHGAAVSGDQLGNYVVQSSDGSGFFDASSFYTSATENWSATARGSLMQILVNRIGTTTLDTGLIIRPSAVTGQTATQSPYVYMNNILQNRRFVLFDNDITSDTEFYGLGANSSVMRYQVPTGGAHVCYISSSERFRVHSTGFVGVNTPTPFARLSNTAGDIQDASAVGVTASDGIAWQNTGTSYGVGLAVFSATGRGILVRNTIGTSTSAALHINRNGTEMVHLGFDGAARKPGGGTWAATSDQRVKQVSGQYTRGLSDVLKLQPVVYSYNGKGGMPDDVSTGIQRVGFLAQDVKKIAPEMVRTLSSPDIADLLVLDVSDMVPMLINAVRQQQAMIDRIMKKLKLK